MPIEHPPATSVDGRSVDEIREEVRREIFEEQRRDGEAAGKQLEHEIRRRREVIVEHRDAQLRAWIDAGELTQRAAELVRSLWAEQGDRPFHIRRFCNAGWRARRSHNADQRNCPTSTTGTHSKVKLDPVSFRP